VNFVKVEIPTVLPPDADPPAIVDGGVSLERGAATELPLVLGGD